MRNNGLQILYNELRIIYIELRILCNGLRLRNHGLRIRHNRLEILAKDKFEVCIEKNPKISGCQCLKFTFCRNP